jgi:2-methylcitrate dehydratase PrpD
MAIAQTLAAYAGATAWRDLPAPVRSEAPRTLLNWLGVAFGACDSDVVRAAIKGLGASGQHRVIGRHERLDQVNAALVNCLSSAVHAFDDTHLGTITHPTGPVAAVSLVVAQNMQSSADDFRTAILLGMEIECRLSEALLAKDGGASIGWYITGVTGGVGVAVAAAKLMKLDEAQTAHAIGIAAAQACGFRGTHGSMAMPMIPGFAARNGLSAALWARAGMTATAQAIEGANGLFDVLAPKADRDAICRDLGARYAMLENAYKPYPCGIVVHPVIDACLDLMAAHDIDPDQIASMNFTVHPVGLHLGGRKNPQNEFEAQVSISYCAAIVLTQRAIHIAHLAKPWLGGKRLAGLEERVTVEADAAVARDAARAVIVMTDGRRLETNIAHARGSLARPMTDAELTEKFLVQAEPVVGAAAGRDFVAAVLTPELDMTRFLGLIESHAGV